MNNYFILYDKNHTKIDVSDSQVIKAEDPDKAIKKLLKSLKMKRKEIRILNMRVLE